MASKQYVGEAPLTMVPRVNGRTEYVYRGQLAPEDATDLDRLVAEGYLKELGKSDVTVGTVEAAPLPNIGAPVPPSTDTAGDPGDGVPNRSASKGDWVAYATSDAAGDKRMPDDEANGATRDDLAERFLGPKAA